MKQAIVIGSAALMVAALFSGAALAQPQWGFGPGYGPGYGMMPSYGAGMMGTPGRGRYAMVDANHDGTVSDEEAASAADEVFTAMDADDDGSLSKDEYLNVRMGRQMGFNAARQTAMQNAKEERFGAMDGDSDGQVSKEEFLAAAEAHHKAADADGDGKVTPWEHRRSNWN